MNSVRRIEDSDSRWHRYWPLILTLAGLIGWGYVTAYRVNANEIDIEKNRVAIESIQKTLSEINIKLGILIDREEHRVK